MELCEFDLDAIFVCFGGIIRPLIWYSRAGWAKKMTHRRDLSLKELGRQQRVVAED